MKKATRFLVPLLLVLFIFASIVWYLFSYDREFTRDTLLSQARFQDTHGNARLSSWFYNMAYSFSGKDENVAIELANQYKSDGNYTKAEYTLTNALNSGATIELYTALCRTYVEQNKLLDAVALLENVRDPALKAELDLLRPKAPEADWAPGYYSQYITVSLSSNGAILYTTNGEYPSTADPVYSAPFQLPAGETTVYTLSVANSGLVSPLTVLSYTITGVIEEVTFTDRAMEAAIRPLIGADENDKVYTNQLWEITEFTAPDGVKDYSDLRLLPHLKTLKISGHKLESLNPLSPLAQLETLDLTSSSFPAEDLSVLAGLPSLKSLTLNDCGLTTIDALAGASSLTVLNLNNNIVRDLSVLTPMVTLKELYLQRNAVVDLSALSSLTELEKLDVYFNSLTTLEPLSSCIKLNWLCADENQITTLAGVSDLPLLRHLSLDKNQLADVSSLAACTGLGTLSIAGNAIEDITMLSTLTELTDFDFSNNKVTALPQWPNGCPLKAITGSYNSLTSIDSLKNMEQLTTITMEYNQLTNIDALADNYCLVTVNVFGNKIKDVSALRDHDIIVNYDPTV